MDTINTRPLKQCTLAETIAKVATTGATGRFHLTAQMLKRVASLLRKHGVRFPLVAAERIRTRLRSRIAHRIYIVRSSTFDRRRSVDTAGIIPESELFIDPVDREQSAPYQPCDEGEFMEGIRTLVPSPRPYTFVDLGCGKGKALVMARDYGFPRAIGAELSSDLVDVARRNFGAIEGIEVIKCNAIDFRYPTGPLCVFMYNPFHSETMSKVLPALAARQETTLVLYQNPRLHMLFLQFGLKERCRGQGWIGYTT